MFNPERFLSQRAAAIDASGVRRVFDLAAQIRDPIDLSIGQPDFDVPSEVQDAAVEAIRSGRNRYTVTQGIAELREKIDQQFKASHAHAGRWQDAGVLITSGVSGALALALLATVDPGDKVLIPDPYFVMYKNLIRLTGAEPVFVDTYPDFHLTAERLAPYVDRRTKVVLASSPSNPTGTVLSESDWTGLVELAENQDLLIINDEIYDVFCYDPVQTPQGPRSFSPASLSDRLVVVRGFSKSYAMSGWRLGYAVGPRAILEQMTKLQQHIFVCAPAPLQVAATTALTSDPTSNVEAYRLKRDRVVDRLSSHYELTVPAGAFYAFPAVPTGETATEFVERAIRRKLMIIPGSVFSERDTHFRLSYACKDSTLERGLDVLLELADPCQRQ